MLSSLVQGLDSKQIGCGGKGHKEAVVVDGYWKVDGTRAHRMTGQVDEDTGVCRIKAVEQDG